MKNTNGMIVNGKLTIGPSTVALTENIWHICPICQETKPSKEKLWSKACEDFICKSCAMEGI